MDNDCPYRLIYSFENEPPFEKPLDYGEYILGRSTHCDIILQDLEVSRRHARLNILPEERFWLTDQGSANGTQLEGKPLLPRKVTQIEIGQTFTIGLFRLQLDHIQESEAARQPPPEFDEEVGEISTYVEGENIAEAVEIGELVTHFQEEYPSDPAPEAIQVEEVPAKEVEAFQIQIRKDSQVIKEKVLTDGSWQIGRENDCDIQLDDPYSSRHHAELRVSSNQITLIDLGSSNGTTKDGKRLTPHEQYPLSSGDGFEIGNFTIRIELITQSVPVENVAEKAPEVVPKVEPVRQHLESLEDVGKPLNLMGLEKVSIGRETDNHIVINHPMVSRYHALIERLGTRFRIIDTQSANGVFVNGEKIQKRGWLKEGDEIKVGPYQFNFTGTMIKQSSAEGYVIDVVNIKKFVTRTLNLLKEINLHIGQNEFVALVGMSGSGKTTLQDAINGYRPATHGQVLVNGVDLYENYDMFRNDIGYVPQRDIVHMELTPVDSLDYAAQLRMPADTTVKERKAAIEQTLDDLGLLERKDIPNSRLSGGQLKRVSIGVELLTRPKLFFLDEPTSGLDPGTEYEMMKMLRRLADQGRTIMLITHATKNVMLCDKVIILASSGHLAFFGPPELALPFFNKYRTRREQLEKDMEFDDIYRILEDESKGTPEDWERRFKEEESKQSKLGIPPAPAEVKPAQKRQRSRIKRVSALKQFFILSARNSKILVNDRVSLLMLLALAPLLGFMNFIWGSKLFDPVLGSVDKVMSMWFMTAVMAILVGSMSSVREIVKELQIYKRERAVGLKIIPYTLSKLWVGGLLSIYAGAILLFFVLIMVRPSIPNLLAYLSFSITIIMGIFSGYLLGLVISAVVPNQNSAMILLIAVLVPHFLLAGVLIPLENMPLGKQISAIISTRWTFEAFVRATGIGDPLVSDPCWGLDKDVRQAITEEGKKRCPCLGASIFENCGTVPGLLSEDFYDDDAKQALAQAGPVKPVEPTSIPSPTPIPSPTLFPSPTPYPTPTSLPPPTMTDAGMAAYMSDVSAQQEEYFEERTYQQNTYVDIVKDINTDWVDDQSEQMEVFAEQSQDQYEIYAQQMETYGDDLANWQKNRQSAIGAAESILSTIYDNYGRTFRNTIFIRWIAQALIGFGFYILIIIFQRRKDVV
jgi:ABC-type multidrug transport system ATPase subunit